jgi:hypothetical protein
LPINSLAGSADEIGKEEGVELRLFGALGHPNPIVRIRASVAVGAWMSPRRRMMAEAHKEGIENKLSLLARHEDLLGARPSY